MDFCFYYSSFLLLQFFTTAAPVYISRACAPCPAPTMPSSEERLLRNFERLRLHFLCARYTKPFENCSFCILGYFGRLDEAEFSLVRNAIHANGGVTSLHHVERSGRLKLYVSSRAFARTNCLRSSGEIVLTVEWLLRVCAGDFEPPVFELDLVPLAVSPPSQHLGRKRRRPAIVPLEGY